MGTLTVPPPAGLRRTAPTAQAPVPAAEGRPGLRRPCQGLIPNRLVRGVRVEAVVVGVGVSMYPMYSPLLHVSFHCMGVGWVGWSFSEERSCMDQTLLPPFVCHSMYPKK